MPPFMSHEPRPRAGRRAPRVPTVGACPAYGLVWGDDVDVAVEEQAAAATAEPADPRSQLRPAGELQPGGTSGRPASAAAVRLEHVDLEADGGKPVGEQSLQLGLRTRWVTGLTRRRVEPDQVGGEIDQLRFAVAQLLDELTLDRGEVHQRKRSRSAGMTRSAAAPSPGASTPRRSRPAHPRLAEHQLRGGSDLVRDRDLRRLELVARRVAVPRRSRSAAIPATPSATSVVPCAPRRPKLSDHHRRRLRPGRGAVCSAGEPRRPDRAGAARASRSGSIGGVDARGCADEAVRRLRDHERRAGAHDYGLSRSTASIRAGSPSGRPARAPAPRARSPRGG